jgi:hypothetical protein
MVGLDLPFCFRRCCQLLALQFLSASPPFPKELPGQCQGSRVHGSWVDMITVFCMESWPGSRGGGGGGQCCSRPARFPGQFNNIQSLAKIPRWKIANRTISQHLSSIYFNCTNILYSFQVDLSILVYCAFLFVGSVRPHMKKIVNFWRGTGHCCHLFGSWSRKIC